MLVEGAVDAAASGMMIPGSVVLEESDSDDPLLRCIGSF